jgi:hypothetical protein
MKTQYYILLSLKTPVGFEHFGQYDFGSDKEAAYALFGSLNGKSEPDDHTLLHIDQMEIIDDMPVKVNTLCCTLEELANNTKIITREIFRMKNLNGMNE